MFAFEWPFSVLLFFLSLLFLLTFLDERNDTHLSKNEISDKRQCSGAGFACVCVRACWLWTRLLWLWTCEIVTLIDILTHAHTCTRHTQRADSGAIQCWCWLGLRQHKMAIACRFIDCLPRNKCHVGPCSGGGKQHHYFHQMCCMYRAVLCRAATHIAYHSHTQHNQIGSHEWMNETRWEKKSSE